MDYSIFSGLKTKEVIANLNNNDELPFSQILSQEDINRNVQNAVIYRERFFTPHVTLWAFLSQVIDDDQSQQAAVSRVVAEFIARGEEPPSANTSAYSSTLPDFPQSRLPPAQYLSRF